jgi:hypothetical protein
MPADLAEAVRSMPCRACHADRGEYCPSEGTHLARWELAAAAGLIAEADYQTAAKAALPAPPGLPPALAVVPERSGVVCETAGHALRWAARDDPPRWEHLDPSAGQTCPDGGRPVAADGEPCRYLRRHWLLGIPAVAVAGTVPACRRCAARHGRRKRLRWRSTTR